MSAGDALRRQAGTPSLPKLAAQVLRAIAKDAAPLDALRADALGALQRREADRDAALAVLDAARLALDDAETPSPQGCREAELSGETGPNDGGVATAAQIRAAKASVTRAAKALEITQGRVRLAASELARLDAMLDQLPAIVVARLVDAHVQAAKIAKGVAAEAAVLDAAVPAAPREKPTAERARRSAVRGVTAEGAVLLTDELPDSLARMVRAGSLSAHEAAGAAAWRADWLALESSGVRTTSFVERVQGGQGWSEHAAMRPIELRERFEAAERALPAEVLEVCRAVILSEVALDRAPGVPAMYAAGSVNRRCAAAAFVLAGSRRLSRVYRLTRAPGTVSA